MDNAASLPDRAVLRLSGEDRRSFLQGLITQDVDRLKPGASIFAALLTPQGKILFDFIIVEHQDAFLLDCRRDSIEALAKRLTLYKLRAKVEIAVDKSLNVSFSDEKPSSPIAYEDPRLPALGWRSINEAANNTDNGTYAQKRIALGIPAFGDDFDADGAFLLDVNYDALNGISYQKGCFVGQEVTSRMKRKGDVRKRTLIASFDGEPPQKGDAVTAGGSTLGEITSVANGAALALIRLDRWEKANTAGDAPQCNGLPLRLALPAYLEQR